MVKEVFYLHYLEQKKYIGIDIDSERIGFFRESLNRWLSICVEMQRVELVVFGYNDLYSRV